MDLVFEWNLLKDQANLEKQKRLLLVCFTEPEEGRVRIISARRATRREQHDYEEHITP